MRIESIFHSHCEARAIIRDLLPNACLTYPSAVNIDPNRGYRIAARGNQRCGRMPFPRWTYSLMRSVEMIVGSNVLHGLIDEKFEDSIDDVYKTFKTRVIDGRDELNDIDKLDDIAMGRVWTGTKAKKYNLIDEVGGLNDAIMLAAKKVGKGKKIPYKLSCILSAQL